MFDICEEFLSCGGDNIAASVKILDGVRRFWTVVDEEDFVFREGTEQ